MSKYVSGFEHLKADLVSNNRVFAKHMMGGASDGCELGNTNTLKNLFINDASPLAPHGIQVIWEHLLPMQQKNMAESSLLFFGSCYEGCIVHRWADTHIL